MNYLLSISFLFTLITYSNFLNLKYKIKINETYLISLCIIILSSYIFFLLKFHFNLIFLNKLLLFFFLIACVLFSFLIKNYRNINFRLNIEFIIIYLIIFVLSKDRYFLDQDEFNYWGLAIKALNYEGVNSIFNSNYEKIFGIFPNLDLYKFSHHPQGLTIFRNLFVPYKFDEGMTIFSNNIILISGFFFLFYKNSLSFFDKIFLYIIFLLLFNNLSFGFVSIYSDPILAIFYACLINKIFFIFFEKKYFENLSIIFIFLTILLINRSSILYFLFALYFVAVFNFIDFYKKKKVTELAIYFLLTITLIYISYLFLIKHYKVIDIIENIISINLYKTEFIKLLITPIYFSNFGVAINGIIELVFSLEFKVNEFKIPLITYIILLIPFIFFEFKYRSFFISSSVLLIFIYMIIVLILKVKIENVHISAIPRYIGILILSKYLFIISIIIHNYKNIHRSYIFLFFLIFLFAVTPKKTFGFFVTKDIYYKSMSNKKYKINRNNISKIKKDHENYLIIHKNNLSDFSNIYISGEHSFYHNIIEYELFPKIPYYIEYSEFLKIKDDIKKEDTLIIMFDLPSSEISKINKNFNFFEIKTY